MVSFPRTNWKERVAQFSRGDWLTLLRQSESITEEASRAACRRRRTRADTLERRAERAAILVQMGEISSGRLALEGAIDVGSCVCQGPMRLYVKSRVAPPKHQMRLHVRPPRCVYMCVTHQMRSHVCHEVATELVSTSRSVCSLGSHVFLTRLN